MVPPGRTMRFTGVSAARTCEVWSLAERAELARASSGRLVARIATASRPAFLAPALPMASVPTGTPPGICTIDSSESSPCSAALCTGTPSTGTHGVRGDHAGQVRGAAGAGDDHLDAARLGALRELGHPHRRAVRRHDRLLVRDAEALEHPSTACDIVSQSEVEPMMTATSGEGDDMDRE